MSLNKFSELFSDLDSNNSTNNKIRLLSEYFLSNDPQENVWTIYLLTGKLFPSYQNPYYSYNNILNQT